MSFGMCGHVASLHSSFHHFSSAMTMKVRKMAKMKNRSQLLHLMIFSAFSFSIIICCLLFVTVQKYMLDVTNVFQKCDGWVTEAVVTEL